MILSMGQQMLVLSILGFPRFIIVKHLFEISQWVEYSFMLAVVALIQACKELAYCPFGLKLK